ncbi:MAG TPA: CoA-binding protein [candidate division Zixibacteria bacterium]|nr:CoA-binding protein [candidate division Zixibacteria bacterium]
MKLEVREFFDNDEFAVVGVSTSRTNFGGSVYLTMKSKGYRVYPVNPKLKEFSGDRCYRNLSELPRSVRAVLVCVKPSSAIAVTKEAVKCGVKHLWYQQGADFSESVKLAREAGLSTVSGKCALMYAEPATGVHRFHGLINKLLGRY